MFRTGFVGRQFPSGVGAGSVTGPMQSLDLNFMTGVLDPRITVARPTTATYFDSTGTMQSAPLATARFDYDPASLQLKGLLVEESRTNSVRNGNATGSVPGTPGTTPTNWSWSGLSGLTSSVVGSGVSNGISYTDVSLSGTASANATIFLAFDGTNNIAANSTQTWTNSVYVSLISGALPPVMLEIREYDSTPTLLTADQQAVTVTNAPLNQQRVSFPKALTQATVAFIRPTIGFTLTSGNVYNFTLRIGAAQLELGAFPTSYIPTTGAAAVSRGGDNISMPTDASWFNPAASSLLADFIVRDRSSVQAGTGPVIVELNDGGNQNVLSVRLNAGATPALNSIIFAGNTLTANTTTTNTWTQNVVSRGATSFSSNSCVNCMDGTISSAASVTGFPTGLNKLGIGLGRTIQLGGYIQRIRYWPRVLSPSEMIQLTTGPTLDIDFRSGILDPRITFTRASAGWYFNSSGVLTQAGNNVPRFDYDKDTLQPLGLLVEEARTNVVRNSVAAGFTPGVIGSGGFMPTNWGLSSAAGLTGTLSDGGVINGMQCIDLRLQGVNTSGFVVFVFDQSVAVPASPGDVYTEAVFAALVGGNLQGINAVNLNVRFTGDGVPLTPINLTNVLTRFTSGPQTAGAGTTAVQPAMQLAVQIGVPIDLTIRVAGPQLELASFSTSYIVTSGAAVTRAQDIAQLAPVVTAPWFNSLAGSHGLEFVVDNALNTTGRFVANTTSRGAVILNDGSFHLGMYDGAGANYTANSITAGVLQKGVTGWTGTNGSYCLNGGTVGSASNFTNGFGTFNGFRFFADNTQPGDSVSGHVRRFRYWPRQLSNAEMQAITT